MPVEAETLDAFFAWVERTGVFSVALHVGDWVGGGAAVVEWAIRRDPPCLAYAGAWTGVRAIEVVALRAERDGWIATSGSNGYSFTLAPLRHPVQFANVAEWRANATAYNLEHIRGHLAERLLQPAAPDRIRGPWGRFRYMWYFVRGFAIDAGWSTVGLLVHDGDQLSFHALPGQEEAARKMDDLVFQVNREDGIEQAWEYLQERGLGLYTTALADPVEVEGHEHEVVSALLKAPPG